jgi:hypothetical protein
MASATEPDAPAEDSSSRLVSMAANEEGGILDARALPSRCWDLLLSRQNGCRAGRLRAAPPPFRPLSRRSGRFPALPYPPLR